VTAALLAASPAFADDLKIGALMPMTGGLAEYGVASLRGVELAADEINKAGGVLGGKVEIRVGDTQTNPQAGVAAAKQLATTAKISGFVGALSSGVTIPIAKSVSSTSDIPQISNASTAPTITVLDDNDFLFRTTPHDALQGVVLGDVVKDAGFGTVSIIYVNNDYGKGLADAFAAQFKKIGGKVAVSFGYEEKQASYRGELAQAAKGGAEALVLIAYPGDGVPILKQALEGEYFTKFLFTDGMKSVDMTKAIPAQYLEGSLGTAPEPRASAAKQHFEQAYKAKYGELPPLPFIAEAYDAMHLLALAAEKAGSTDGKAVRDALRAVANPPGEEVFPGEWAKARKLLAEGKDIDYAGAAGSQNLDAAGDVPGTYGIWTVEKGELKTLRIVEPKLM
jgi:ABC-type branched-subunit amino acid transport system substrate-binding protein